MTDCKTITFRPTPTSSEQLAELMAKWGGKRSEVINRAIGVALAHSAKSPDVIADNDRGSARIEESWRELEEKDHADCERRSPRSRMRYLKTSDIDHEKLAAFQRKADMTVERKRR